MSCGITTDFHCVAWLFRRVFHVDAAASGWLVWWRIVRLFRILLGGVVREAPPGLPGVLLDSSNANESSLIGRDGGLRESIGERFGLWAVAIA